MGENLQRAAGGIVSGVFAIDPAGCGAYSPFHVVWDRFSDADPPDVAGGENCFHDA